MDDLTEDERTQAFLNAINPARERAKATHLAAIHQEAILFAIERAFDVGFAAALNIAWCEDFNARVSQEQERIRERRTNVLNLIREKESSKA